MKYCFAPWPGLVAKQKRQKCLYSKCPNCSNCFFVGTFWAHAHLLFPVLPNSSQSSPALSTFKTSDISVATTLASEYSHASCPNCPTCSNCPKPLSVDHRREFLSVPAILMKLPGHENPSCILSQISATKITKPSSLQISSCNTSDKTHKTSQNKQEFEERYGEM